MSSFKNTLLKFVFIILGKFSKTKSKASQKKILIVSTTGMGDTLWATPAINYLAEVHHCSVDILTSTVGIQVLLENPHINTIYCYRSNRIIELLSLTKKMLLAPYHQVFLFHASQRIIPYIAYLGNPKAFYGIDRLSDKVSDMYTGMLEIEKYPNSHQVEWRLTLVERIYSKSNHLDFKPKLEIFLTDNETLQVNEFINKHGLDKGDYVFIQPAANRKHRQWLPEHFKAVVSYFAGELNKKVIVSGSSSEIDLVRYIVDGENENVIAILGDLSLKVVAGIIQHAGFMLTNDTGPMHLGVAYQIPMIVIMLDKYYFESRPILNASYTKVLKVSHYKEDEYISTPAVDSVLTEINNFFIKQGIK
ncbi:glycosyltransferase family 9 protein [Thiotrichales bacterium 19S3-7]|nr:glycosyltransferase family 9 protein [Thiotrichales bacterium 19S3-7]MCF6801485.1 glycosyltransferase family 9 protein [Thiotrichales bacterium 19S3-11]